MNDEEERHVQIRAKLTAELFDAYGSRPSEDAQVCGLLITLIACAFVIWFGGKPDTDLITLLGIFAMDLGAFVILAGEISLATKIKRGSMQLLQFALNSANFFHKKL